MIGGGGLRVGVVVGGVGYGSLKQDLSSLTRDQTQAMEVRVPNPNH